jgi:hypothetical protein
MEEAPRTIARARELLIVSAAGLALALLMTWPLAKDLGGLGRTHPNDADGQFAIWNVAWVARTLVVDPLRLFDANIYHPHKLTLAYSEANILTGAIGAPVYWLSRNPWLTLNAVMLFGFASAYAAAYFLMRHLTGSRHASAAAAVLYAFCPYVFSHLSHIQLLMTGGVPLALWLLHRLADDASLRRARGAGADLRLLRHLRRTRRRLRRAGARRDPQPVETAHLLDRRRRRRRHLDRDRHPLLHPVPAGPG